MSPSMFERIGSGPQPVDLARYPALSDFDLVVPRMVVAVAPGAGQQTSQNFQIKVSTGWAYLWVGMRAQWSHSNFLFQISDSAGRALQSEPVAGPLALVGLIGRPLGLYMPLAPGADITGRVINLYTVLPLTFDLALLGFKCSPVRG